MRRGAWHQFGHNSQRLVLEQLENGNGEGVVLSPRDLSWGLAKRYESEYHNLDAHVLIDQQFYIPDYTNQNLSTYPLSHHRSTITNLCDISDHRLNDLKSNLQTINSEL